MGLMLNLALAYIAISLLLKKLYEDIVFFCKGNWKYRFLNALADYVYYGATDIGIRASLSLDSPSPDVLERRLCGHAYLESKLQSSRNTSIALESSSSSTSDSRQAVLLAEKMVDCRFALRKLLMPLLRELEFAPINFVSRVEETNDDDNDSGGMIRVTSPSIGENMPYVGNDAVSTLGVSSFYAPVQEEINRRMSLQQAETKDPNSMLRFAPITLNPELQRNMELILGLTGMDQIRYSLSGSEAVDAAFKDIRASCQGKQWIVRFKSAYHGHTSGVDFLNGSNMIYLKECDASSLQFIRQYHHRIAAVVVNPMQHFTGINQISAPGEKLTVSSRVRTTMNKDEYAQWLHDLAETCQYCTKFLTKMALVLDDIYFAFRTPELFSFRYFTHPKTGQALQPDVIVLGKGIAAGYPLSVVVGKKGFLNSYDKKFLLKVNKTVGTLSAWHGGIVASNVFLEALTGACTNKVILPEPATKQLEDMVERFNAFVLRANELFQSKELPLRLRNFANVFTFDYLSTSLYNSRYVQYLLAEGVFLGNYSTGKFNLNAATTNADLDDLLQCFVAAGVRMKNDGYFVPNYRAKPIFVFSLIARFFGNYLRYWYDKMMYDKHIDIIVSHNHPVNKFTHFWSSVATVVYAYPLMLKNEPFKASVAHFSFQAFRQVGHFFYEHQDKDIEKLKFGHKDKSKKEAVAFVAVATAAYIYRSMWLPFVARFVDIESVGTGEILAFLFSMTLIPHYVEITHTYGYLRGLEWVIKILTDPLTDLYDFYDYWIIHPKWFLNVKNQWAEYKLDLDTKKISVLSKENGTRKTTKTL